MTRHEHLRKICEEMMPLLPVDFRMLPLDEQLRRCAVEMFLLGVAYWQENDALAVKCALDEMRDTGQISEYEYPA